MEIRDLESLGPLVASSLRSDATAQGPRLSKSRISTDSASNLYVVVVVMIGEHCECYLFDWPDKLNCSISPYDETNLILTATATIPGASVTAGTLTIECTLLITINTSHCDNQCDR